jgi:Photosynthetic reaction centre cytochrome C subunit
MKERRAFVLGTVAFFAAFGLVTIRASGQSAGTPGASTNPVAPRKAEEQFKNIQVLKGIPADQLIPSMQFITVSLGVECEFCHVQGAFEKDDKKAKQTARRMMEMMFAINADNFGGHRDVLLLPSRQHQAVGDANY